MEDNDVIAVRFIRSLARAIDPREDNLKVYIDTFLSTDGDRSAAYLHLLRAAEAVDILYKLSAWLIPVVR